MKFSTLLAIIFLTLTFNVAQAAEKGAANEALAKCTEEAAAAGIQDADEKQEFITECIDTAVSAGDGD